MTENAKTKSLYRDVVIALLAEYQQENIIRQFNEYWNSGDYRNAYLLIENLPQFMKTSNAYKNADENFYWTFIQ